MNTRIKELRKALGLTQQEFADKIGSVQNTITGYETGRRAPSNQVIALLCREFNVNEAWLRTGEGAMFKKVSRDEQIAEYIGNVLALEDGSFQKRLLNALTRLDINDWAVLEKMALLISETKEKD